MDDSRELLSLADIAGRAGMPYIKVWRMWSEQKLPAASARQGHRSFWYPDVIDAWIAEQDKS